MSRPATREDVFDCYKNIFRREPENEDVVLKHLADNPSLWDLIRRLINSDEHKVLAQNNGPTSMFKCRTARYLAKSISVSQRYLCFLSNYTHLSQAMLPDHFDKLLYRELKLFEYRSENNLYTVTVQTSRVIINEGELSLLFRANGDPLYLVSFTIVSGSIVKLSCAHTILISRMQGYGKGKFEAIRVATKEMNEVSPQAVLYSILEGIAEASGFKQIVGISGINHINYEDGFSELFSQAYDRFFMSLDAATLGDGFYVLDVPLRQKSMSLIKLGHRLRTKKKRETKRNISRSARQSWLALLNPSGVAQSL